MPPTLILLIALTRSVWFAIVKTSGVMTTPSGALAAEAVVPSGAVKVATASIKLPMSLSCTA